MVEKKCTIDKIELLGIFDKHADIDVYAVKLTKREIPLEAISTTSKIQIQKLENLFDISVGSVVDNRDPKKGPSKPYVISRGLAGWSIQNEFQKVRKHEGKSIKSPFVVIKRTSRKEDKHRAIATIINVKRPVFVDNHLIVLQPKTKTLRECKKAFLILKNTKTNEWLNEQIRCRHLTVKLVKEIPVWN